MSKMESKPPSGRITWEVAVNMTTPGAILLSATAPALLGVLLSVEKLGTVSPLLAILLVLIPSLMNASVDVLNDYYDYVRGNDTAGNIVSESDGPLAYHQVADPRPALWIGWGLLLAAVLPGIYVIWKTGPLPAVIGVVGGVILVTYSCGSLPTSYLPIGELLSGFTLGGLVPLGVFTAFTGQISLSVLWKSIPMMMVVAEFMLVNNDCDWERDREAGRRTLPILIGKKASKRLADVTMVIWMIWMVGVIAICYPRGMAVILVACLVCGRGIWASFHCERSRETKKEVTAFVALTALGVAVGYPLAIAVHLCL